MQKTLVSITDRQMEVLTENSKALGISKSELLRRILDRYLDVGRKMNEKKVVHKSSASKD